MKKLLVLLFSILISFNSYGEWTEVSYNKIDDKVYVDNNSIREHNGYVYWWELGDLKEPLTSGGKRFFSTKVYNQGDCGVFRYRVIDFHIFQQQMGEGRNESYTPENPEWIYHFPDSIGESLLDYACNSVK